MRFGTSSSALRMYNLVDNLDEDLQEFVTAEEIGLRTVWTSEHTGRHRLPMGLPAPELLIAKAALTERIRFRTAVRRIAL